MCALTAGDLHGLTPWRSNNHWTTPQLDEDGGARADNELKGVFARSRVNLRATAPRCFTAAAHGIHHVHGCDVRRDHEFAFYGPMGFDVARLTAFSWRISRRMGTGDRSAARLVAEMRG